MPELNKAAAEKLMRALVRQSVELDSCLLEIQSLCTDTEFKNFKRIVGRILGSMLLDGINVLSEEFPDLKPRGLD
jgi:hypothetical protein